MNKFIFSFIFLTFIAQAADLRLELSKPVIKQGSLITAIAVMQSESVQQVDLQKMKGSSLADTIYIYQVSPLIRKPDNKFESELKIIFLKVPESQSLIHKLDDKELTVTWSNVKILPTEKVKELIFGKFQIPTRIKILQWTIGLLVLGIALVLSLKMWQKLKSKKMILKRKKELKHKMISAQDYSEVVKIWQQKEMFLTEFPALEIPLKQLEIVLFKYQFKPSQNEVEKSEVMKAYREFITQSSGGL